MKIEKVQLARESIYDIKLTPKCWFIRKMAKNPLFGKKKQEKKQEKKNILLKFDVKYWFSGSFPFQKN